MVLLYKSLAVLLLFLTLDPTLRLTHALSTSSPTTRTRIQFMTDDTDYDDDDSPSDSPNVPTPVPTRILDKLCQYDPCREDQPPCTNHLAQIGCLCPGLSGAHQLPHPPRLQGLLPAGSSEGGGGGVEVQWCAPSSVVSGYRVVVEGNRSAALEFGAQARRGQLRPLEAGAKVCVEAVNGVGRSVASELSCKRYHPPTPHSSSVKAGLIGGGVAVLLLLAVMAIMILWKRRARRKSTEGAAEGLGNPSYSAEGNL